MPRILLALILLLVWSPLVSADINVFIYHRFGDSRYPSTNISLETFAAQLALLKDRNIPVLPLSKIAQMVRDRQPLPARAVGLCIDDAFLSFNQGALPLLQQYGFPATLFVNTDAVGESGYLDWAQLQEAMAQGVEIGNHTASHAYLVEMRKGETFPQWRVRIRSDIERSKRALKQHLGIEPEIFAYTYGEYSPAVSEIVREAGFKAAFAQQSGVIYSDSDIWALPRFPMGGDYATLDGFEAKLNTLALEVGNVSPLDPIVGAQNPPRLRLTLENEEFAHGQINCFAQSGNVCKVRHNPANPKEIEVVAEKPLRGRRNKYTLTSLGKDHRWHWYSHLWINAERPARSEEDQL